MPKTMGGLLGWTVSALIMTAVSIAILSRTPIYGMLFPKQG